VAAVALINSTAAPASRVVGFIEVPSGAIIPSRVSLVTAAGLD
jgi:hypothetical protein